MSNTLVVDLAGQQASAGCDAAVLGFRSVLPSSTIIPDELTIDSFRDGVRPLLLSNPLAHLFAPGNAEKFLTSGTLTTDRATIGTFIDKNDGLLKTAAIDTIREETEGFLIEGESTNLLLRSEEFDNGAWAKVNSSISPNTTTAPDDATTADSLIEDTANGSHNTNQTIAFVDGNTYTATFFIKPNGRDIVKVGAGNPATWGAGTVFDLSTGSIVTSLFGTATIETAANGFFKCTVTGLATSTASTGVVVFLIDSGTNTTYTGDGVSGVFLWGAQLEELPFASSYIKTVASTVTRNADNVSIDADNIPGPTEEYSVLVTIDILGVVGGEQRAWNVSGENFRQFRANQAGTNVPRYFHGSAGGSDFIDGTSLPDNTVTKFASVFDGTTFELFQSGVSEGSDSTFTAITGSKSAIEIGRAGSSSHIFGHILDFMIFERGLNQLEIILLNSGADLPPTNSSEEDPLFPFVNTLDFRDNTKYSPLVTSGTVVIDFKQSSVVGIDYFSFAIHNSQDAGLTGKLEVDSGLGFVVVAEFASIKNNRPFLKRFNSGLLQSVSQRLTLNFTSKLFIGSINIGESVVFNRGPSIGFQPGRTASNDIVEQFTTEGNNFIIGRRLNRGFNSKGSFRFRPIADVDDWYEEYMNHVLDSKTLYFKWNKSKDETIYGLQNPTTITKPTYVTSFNYDFTIDINGYA